MIKLIDLLEKLDSVGKEDEDVNNDGKKNTKTDKYLLKRRKAISKNLKEENIPAPLASLYDLVEKLVAQGITKDEILRIVNFATAKLNEGDDHEVSMAVSSLEAIAEAIIELRQKLGNTERNIPGWIQDHVAKAENYIEQAAQGFHELKGDDLDEAVKVRREKVRGRGLELIISSRDKSEVEKEINKIEREYPSAGYGTTVKKSPYQKGDTWIAVVSHGTTSD